LLQEAIHDLYTNVSSTETFSWFTNSFENKKTTGSTFKEDVIKLPYTNSQYSFQEVLLKGQQLFSNTNNTYKRFVIISDFQNTEIPTSLPDDIHLELVQLQPVKDANLSIDTVFVTKRNVDGFEIMVKASSYGNTVKTTPISLWDANTLIAKSSVDFSTNTQQSISFTVPTKKEAFKGVIRIEDPDLLFDNALYFTINPSKKIKVLEIGETKEASQLSQIFTEDEFLYTYQNQSKLNYNIISSQNLIILNEIDNIPLSLQNALNVFSNNGGSIAVIPSLNAMLSSYNSLLNKLQLGTIDSIIPQENRITKINFQHPIYNNVFEKETTNFQYPKVQNYYSIKTNASAFITFENNRPFGIQNELYYFITAPVNTENANFYQSPLIVPTFYNIAKSSLPLPQLYYTIDSENTYAIPIQIGQDAVLTLQDSLVNFIPLQQSKANSVRITTGSNPSHQGTFAVKNKDTIVQYVSYNYSREESSPTYFSIKENETVTLHQSIASLFSKLNSENDVEEYWKWFLIFALCLFLVEMLILKYFK